MKENNYDYVPTLLPVGDIYICRDKKCFKYAPLEDITTHEVALLFPLFLSSFVVQSTCYDYVAYIEDNNLMRHFKEKKDE